MHLHLIVRFSYYPHLHLQLLKSVLARCSVGAVLQFGLDSFGPAQISFFFFFLCINYFDHFGGGMFFLKIECVDCNFTNKLEGVNVIYPN